MSERDYAKSIIDIIPKEHLGEVIAYMLSIESSGYDEEKFKLRRYLHEGKGPQIEMLINRNNREEKVKILDEQGNQIRSIITKSQKLHDDISIVF